MRVVNKRARHDYHVLQTLETGVVLSGPEVKSVRLGRVDLSNSFARVENGQLVLKNAYIYPYQDKSDEYNPRRDRKLLAHKKEINNLIGKLSASATTLIPLALYTKRNFIKAEIALAANKKKFDKRKAIKARDEQRRIAQEFNKF